eukprot:TRINITY_DN354_c0_g1_i1.p1 TRINITY_DN354_c0_g1~~TRINITY_DN354_c0_g1_i1.p1  ORF type:complete len:426 (-),score=120.34 TRINITY_DN354_c0_g1_i1:165-1442(-)
MSDEEEVDIGDEEVGPDDQDPTASPGGKQSWAMRSKKFIATKTANNKVGRKVIFQALGEDGERLFTAVMDALKIFYGDKQGAQVGKDILTLVLKVKILFDEEILSFDKFKESEEVAHSLLFEAQKSFDTRTSEGSSSSSDEKKDSGKRIINPVQLSRILLEIRDTWKVIFKEMMTEKNVAKFVNLLTMIGDPEFLYAFLNDDKFQRVKGETDASFRAIMQNVHLRDPRIERTCRFANCTSTAIRSQGLFRSAGFCGSHHIEHFQSIWTDPCLSHFIYEDEQNTLFFVDYLKKHSEESKGEDPVGCFNFLMQFMQWKSISSKDMRLTRAKTIASKFLDPTSPNALPFAAEVGAEILQDLDVRDKNSARLPFDYFDRASQACTYTLEKEFQKFLKSSDFERFLASTQLPKDELNMVRKASVYNLKKQ